MTPFKSTCLVAILLASASCSAGAPRAPIGLDKQPANTLPAGVASNASQG